MPSTPEAAVVDHIVNPIRNRFPVCDGAVIIDIASRILPFGLPFPPIVLEISNEFLLLTINGNHRQALGFKGFPGSIDLLKLGGSIGMRCPLDRLLGSFEGTSHPFKALPDGGLANRVSLPLERFFELTHRFGCPAHEARRIPFRLKQILQIGAQGLVLGSDLLAPSTPPADATSWLIEFSRLHFLQSLADCFASDSCLAGHLAYRATASSLGFSRYIQPPLSLIEHSVHHCVLILLREPYHVLSLSHQSPSVYFISVSLLRLRYAENRT